MNILPVGFIFIGRVACGVYWQAAMLLTLLSVPHFAAGAGQASAPATPAAMTFQVRHGHAFRHCEGALRLDESGIFYESSHAEHSRRWSFRDIRHIEIESPTELVVLTYGKPARFTFELRQGNFSEAYRFLAGRLERGLTSRILAPAAEEKRFEVPTKHRHGRGGCEGVLRIGETEILYETDHAEDKRIWRIRDLRSFGTSGPYQLRLATERETFTFDLKEPLPQDVYDFLWQKVYDVGFSPSRPRV